MTSVHFFLHPLSSGSEDLFHKRLYEIGDRLNKRGYSWPATFLPVSNGSIKSCAVGPSHVALLLHDGRVCRTSLQVYSDMINLNLKDDSSSKGPKPTGGGSTPSSTTGTVTTTATSRADTTGGAAKPNKIRRVAVMTSGGGRGRTARGVIVGSRPLIPASAVPEDLIAQAQVVLQGKSREMIVRELQRTGLDVNQAVNNLLSRDDDDGDDYDDAADSLLPEELISLLDAGLGDGHANVIIDADSFYSDEVFGYSTIRRRANEKAVADKEQSKEATKSAAPSHHLCPVVPTGVLEFWDEKMLKVPRFVSIGATNSELLAVSSNGKLYRWLWEDSGINASELPECKIHPRSEKLGIGGEVVIKDMSCSMIRTTLLMESSKVASFMDESLGGDICQALDRPIVDLAEPIVSVKSCPLFSAAHGQSGFVYWWGVMPFYLRKRMLEKAKAKAKKHVTFDSSEITIGAQVRLRANPLYQIGSVGFTTINGYPQVGVLMEAAWTMTESCRFRIKDATELKQSTNAVRSSDLACSEQMSKADGGGKRPASPGLTPSPKEEAWNIRDVIFYEEAKALTCGTVLMVDGAYCAVSFPDKEGKLSEDGKADLKSCRLLRKDELQVLKLGAVMKSLECIQKDPKRLNLRPKGVILDFNADAQGLKVLVQRQAKLSIVSYNLLGVPDHEAPFPTNAAAFVGTKTCKPLCINYGEENVFILRDGNGCIYPVQRNSLGGVKDPLPAYLPPLTTIGIGVHPVKLSSGLRNKSRLAIGLVVFKSRTLMEHILQCDVDSVIHFVTNLEREKNLDKAQTEILEARTENNFNILHACVGLCVPPTNKDAVDLATGKDKLESISVPSPVTKGSSRICYDTKWEELVGSTRSYRNILANEMNLRRLSNFSSPQSIRETAENYSSSRGGPADSSHLDSRKPAEAADDSATMEGRFYSSLEIPILGVSSQQDGEPMNEEISTIPLPPIHTPKPVLDVKQRQLNAYAILKFLCENAFVNGYLQELLLEKDGYGRTPFIYAISCRAYCPALTLLSAAQKVVSPQSESFHSMIRPESAENPLAILCYNDTCSFTWTGNEHINQDIFECKTCGLVGSLCCCSECASVCHKGHECKLKRTSPTAYCDCWEKCKCQALIAGDFNARMSLLNKLLTETDLVTRPNRKGEHILLFLVKTVARQSVEQRQYKPSRAKNAQKNPADGDLPENDLEPPRFARKAMERLLSDWVSVRSMICSGCKVVSSSSTMFENEFYLSAQEGSVYLDRFLYTLLMKCSAEILDTLINTIIREIQNPVHSEDAKFVASRLVRSAVRIFVAAESSVSAGVVKRRRVGERTDPVMRCRRVFQSLITFALKELCEAADAILAPVRLGLVKPSVPFALNASCVDATESCDKVFSVEPFWPISNKSDMDSRNSFESERPRKDESDNQDLSDSDSDSEKSGPPFHGSGRESSRDSRTLSPVIPTARRRTSMGRDNSDFEVRGGTRRRISRSSRGGRNSGGRRRKSERSEEPRDPRVQPTAEAAGSDQNENGQPAADSEAVAEESAVATTQSASAMPRQMGIRTPARDRVDFFDDVRSTESPNESPNHSDEERSETGDDDEESSQRVFVTAESEDQSDGDNTGDDDQSMESANESDQDEEEVEEDDHDDDDDEADEDGDVAADNNHDYASPQDFLMNMFDRSARDTERSTTSARTRGSDINSANLSSSSLGWAIRSAARATDSGSNAAGQNASNADRDRNRSNNNTTASRAVTTATATPTTTASQNARDDRGSGLIFLDPGSLRRQASIAIANAAAADSAANVPTTKESGPSVSLSAQLLARVYSVIIRQLTDLLGIAYDYQSLAPSLTFLLAVSREEIAALETYISNKLKPSWDWVFTVLDSLEAQLRFGSALTASTDSSHVAHPFNPANAAGSASGSQSAVESSSTTSTSGGATVTSSAATTSQPAASGLTTTTGGSGGSITSTAYTVSTAADARRAVTRLIMSASGAAADTEVPTSGARRDFIHYVLSLLRSHSHEHGDELPVLDITAMKHVAYVTDSLFYFIQSSSNRENLTRPTKDLPYRDSPSSPSVSSEGVGGPNSATLDKNGDDVGHFFERSESMMFPGVPEPCDPFQNSVPESLPLASKPFLLQPEASKEKMFGFTEKPISLEKHAVLASERGNINPTNLSLSHCGFSQRSVGQADKSISPDLDFLGIEPSAVLGISDEKGAEPYVTKKALKAALEAVSRTLDQDDSMGEEEMKARKQSVIVHSSSVAKESASGSKGIYSRNKLLHLRSVDALQLAGGIASRAMPIDMDRQWLGRVNYLMGRWKVALMMLGKVFCDDVAQETGSTLIQLAGFPVKEAKFRKEMERFRNQQGKDLVLEVVRERHLLIQQTIKQLNQFFVRRSGITSGQPMAVHKVKVTFKDEPGEGTGVARSYYAAIAEAFLAPDRLPNLEHCQQNGGGSSSCRLQHQNLELLNRLRSRESSRRSTAGGPGSRGTRRFQLNPNATAFEPSPNLDAREREEASAYVDISKQGIGDRLYQRIRQMRPSFQQLAAKITGMLLELPMHHLVVLLTADESLRTHVEDATDLIFGQQSQDAFASGYEAEAERVAQSGLSDMARRTISTPNLGDFVASLDPEDLIDSAPLFFQPGSGMYSPNPGKNSPERLNAFRNVGRMIGIALLQNELFPMPLCRHVLKFILGRPITWYDLAFFDMDLFETLRKTVKDNGDPADLHLNFSITLLSDEGGGTVELKPGGSEIEVTSANLVEYIYLYTEYRLVKVAEKALEAIKQGVYEVLPTSSTENLTSEDLRLLLNGLVEVNTSLLQAYTTFSDESNASSEQLAKFKKWFWAVVEKMTPQEKQDLVYFWTGSPSLPSSEEGFQPLPSVLVRPAEADDQHLPTANTCISRLYVPLYSSKGILKQKILVAIKSRNFGFV